MSIRLAFRHASLTANDYRRQVIDGRRYLVAPISAIVPGVLNGSKGALYYPASEVSHNVSKWDRTPITVDHPYDPTTNEPLTAGDKGVLERQGIGFIDKTTYNGKLKTLGYFDEERVKKISPEIHKAILTNKPVEISTGLFTDNHDAPTGANFNGKPYDYVAKNYRPDHLAVLPNQVGACSIKDGCGLLVNSMVRNSATGKKIVANGADLHRLLDIIANAIPRHPKTGQFQEQPGPSARRGFEGADQELHEADAAAELVGDPNPKGFDGRQLTTTEREDTPEDGIAEIDDVDDHHEDDADEWMKPLKHLAKSPPNKDISRKSAIGSKPQKNEGDNPFVGNAAKAVDPQLWAIHNAGWTQDKRDALPKEDFAGPNQSFPIKTQKDVEDAARLTGHAQDPEAVKSKIKKIAKRKGFDVPDSYKDEPAKNAVNPAGVTSMYPEAHDASQQAAQSTIATEHAGARSHALAALDSSGDDEHGDAMKSHKAAAVMHEKAATDARKNKNFDEADQHDQAAALHRKAASMHDVENCSMNRRTTTTNVDPNWADNDDERKAAMAHIMAGESSNEASHASDRANKSGSKTAHKAAAEAHREAAEKMHASGNEKLGKAHEKAAREHDRKASGKSTRNRESIPMTKEYALNILTKKCSCEADMAALNELDEKTLFKLAYNEKAQGSNADAAGSGDFDDGIIAGGEDDTEKDKNDEDWDEDSEDQVKKKKGPEMNSAKTDAEYLATLPPRWRGIVANSLRHDQQQREAIADRLTAHIEHKGARAFVKNKLMSHSLHELHAFAMIIPTNNYMTPVPSQDVGPIYTGAQGGFAGNAASDGSDDVLVMPKMQFTNDVAADIRKIG